MTNSQVKDAPIENCPFCGGEAEIIDATEYRGETYYPNCKNDNCGAHWDMAYANETDAIKAWNTRTDTKHSQMLDIAVGALNQLARLGNGELLGNSDGNIIAQKALSKIESLKTIKGE